MHMDTALHWLLANQLRYSFALRRRRKRLKFTSTANNWLSVRTQFIFRLASVCNTSLCISKKSKPSADTCIMSIVGYMEVEPCAGRAAADNLWAPPPTFLIGAPPPTPIICRSRSAADAIVAVYLFCCKFRWLKNMGVESRGGPRIRHLFPRNFWHSAVNFPNFIFSRNNSSIFIRHFFSHRLKILNFPLFSLFL